MAFRGVLPSLLTLSFGGASTQESPTEGIKGRYRQKEADFAKQWSALEPQTKFMLVRMLSILLLDMKDETGSNKGMARDVAAYLSGNKDLSKVPVSVRLFLPSLSPEMQAMFNFLLWSGRGEEDSKTIDKLEFLFEHLLLQTLRQMEILFRPEKRAEYFWGKYDGLNKKFFTLIFYNKDCQRCIFRQKPEELKESSRGILNDFKAFVRDCFVEAEGSAGLLNLGLDFLSEDEVINEVNGGLIKPAVLDNIRNSSVGKTGSSSDECYVVLATIVHKAFFPSGDSDALAEEFRLAILEGIKEVKTVDEKPKTPIEFNSDLLWLCLTQVVERKPDDLPDHHLENRRQLQNAIINGLQSNPPTISINYPLVEFAFFLNVLQGEETGDIAPDAVASMEERQDIERLQNAIVEGAKFIAESAPSFLPVLKKQEEVFSWLLLAATHQHRQENIPEEWREKFHELKSALVAYRKKILTQALADSSIPYLPNPQKTVEVLVKKSLAGGYLPENQALLDECVFHFWVRGHISDPEQGKEIFDRLIYDELAFDTSSIDEEGIKFLRREFSSRGYSIQDFLTFHIDRFLQDQVGMLEEMISDFKI